MILSIIRTAFLFLNFLIQLDKANKGSANHFIIFLMRVGQVSIWGVAFASIFFDKQPILFYALVGAAPLLIQLFIEEEQKYLNKIEQK